MRDIGHESVPILTELRGTVRATNDEALKLSVVTEGLPRSAATRRWSARTPHRPVCSQRPSADRWSRRRLSAMASERRFVATARAAVGRSGVCDGPTLGVVRYRRGRRGLCDHENPGVSEEGAPGAIGQRVAESANGISESARAFVDRVRAGMAERETELRDTLNLPDDQR